MLIRADDACLLVVDLQERLAPAIADKEAAVGNCARLLQAAERLAVPVLISEQYPRGLGTTMPAIASLAPQAQRIEKLSFSCMGETAFTEALESLGRSQVVVCGMEAHVCVLQTAMEMQASGIETFVVADATGSRQEESKRVALARMARAGVEVVTSEMVIFEWLGRAGSEAFREVSKLVR